MPKHHASLFIIIGTLVFSTIIIFSGTALLHEIHVTNHAQSSEPRVHATSSKERNTPITLHHQTFQQSISNNSADDEDENATSNKNAKDLNHRVNHYLNRITNLSQYNVSRKIMPHESLSNGDVKDFTEFLYFTRK